MNAQTVLLVVTFLAAATLALGTNLPNRPSDGAPAPPVPVPDPMNRNAKHVLGEPGAATPPVTGDTPDDLKADGFFWPVYGGYYGGWGGGWGGWGRGYYGGYRRYGYGWPYYGGGYYGW